MKITQLSGSPNTNFDVCLKCPLIHNSFSYPSREYKTHLKTVQRLPLTTVSYLTQPLLPNDKQIPQHYTIKKHNRRLLTVLLKHLWKARLSFTMLLPDGYWIFSSFELPLCVLPISPIHFSMSIGIKQLSIKLNIIQNAVAF